MAAEDDLATAQDRAALLLKELLKQAKPDYSIDSQSVQWLAYQEFLARLPALLQAQQVVTQGPFEVRSIGRT